MAKTSFEEEVYLRALTGRLVGEHLLASYNKVAVVSMKNIICCSTATAAEAVFISQTGGRTKHFIVESGNESATAKKLEEYDGEAILLLFGGETPIEEAKQIFSKLLEGMASHDIIADIIIHVRIFAAGGLEEAIKNEKTREYLRNRIVYVYTFDLDEGLMLVHEIEFEEGITLHKIAEIPVTCEHANLLNKSLRDKSIAWVEG